MLLVFAAGSVLCLGDMRGADAPSSAQASAAQGSAAQEIATSGTPDRSPNVIRDKGTNAPVIGPRPGKYERAVIESTKLAPDAEAAAKEAKEAPTKPAKSDETLAGDPLAESEPSEGAPAKLTPKQIAFVKSALVPALQAGEPATILNLVSGEMPRWTDSRIDGFNQLLDELGAPSLDKMITDAHMNLARAGMTDEEFKGSAREAAIVLREIKRQIDEILKNVQGVELMKDPLPQPQSLKEFRDVLWAAHVQNNQLINSQALAHQGDLIAHSRIVAKAKHATAADKVIFATNFQDITSRIRDIHRELNERGVELRVERVKFAVKVLQDSQDIKERFFAAYAVGIDGELLMNGFKEFPGPFGRKSLNEQGYVESLHSNVDRGRQLAGDLVEKSQLLFAGLHWWRRGRYGRGPELYGLLKSKAAQTDAAAQIPLLMPRESPVPVDPAQNPDRQSPDYDRRHHYTWAWQTRQFQMTSRGSGQPFSVQSGSSSAGREIQGHFDGIVGGMFL